MSLSDSIRISVLVSWPQDSPPLRLVISRWLACEHNHCLTLVSALAPKRKITQVITLPSGVWFTSMVRLATKQKLQFSPFRMLDLLAADLSPFWPTHLTSAPTGNTHSHTQRHTHTPHQHTHTHHTQTHTHTHRDTHTHTHTTHTHTPHTQTVDRVQGLYLGMF